MIVQLPNGENAEFPDGMPQEQVLGIIQKQFPSGAQQDISRVEGAAKQAGVPPLPPPVGLLQSIPRGFRQGMAKSIAQMGAAAGQLGPPANEVGQPIQDVPGGVTPSYQEIESQLFGAMKGPSPDTSRGAGGPWYAPWKLARTAGQVAGFAPLEGAAGIGPAIGLGRKAAGAIGGALYGAMGEHPAIGTPLGAVGGAGLAAVPGVAKKGYELLKQGAGGVKKWLGKPLPGGAFTQHGPEVPTEIGLGGVQGAEQHFPHLSTAPPEVEPFKPLGAEAAKATMEEEFAAAQKLDQAGIGLEQTQEPAFMSSLDEPSFQRASSWAPPPPAPGPFSPRTTGPLSPMEASTLQKDILAQRRGSFLKQTMEAAKPSAEREAAWPSLQTTPKLRYGAGLGDLNMPRRFKQDEVMGVIKLLQTIGQLGK